LPALLWNYTIYTIIELKEYPGLRGSGFKALQGCE
jgi:hypothetical protein